MSCSLCVKRRVTDAFCFLRPLGFPSHALASSSPSKTATTSGSSICIYVSDEAGQTSDTPFHLQTSGSEVIGGIRVMTIQPPFETKDRLASLSLLNFVVAMRLRATGTHAVGHRECAPMDCAHVGEMIVFRTEAIARGCQAFGAMVGVAAWMTDAYAIHDTRGQTRWRVPDSESGATSNPAEDGNHNSLVGSEGELGGRIFSHSLQAWAHICCPVPTIR